MPIPPPPATDPSQQAPDPATVSVSGAGSGSRGDALKQWLNNFTGGGMPEVQKQIDQHHQQRLADVQLHAKTWKDLQSEYATNPNGKYWAKDAQGKPTPTPDGQQLLMQIQTAQQAFQKVAGVNKESKSIIGKLGQVVSAVSHHGRDQQSGAAAPDASASGSTLATGMPQPPQAAAPAGGSPSPTGSGMPTPPFIDPSVGLQQDQAAAADAQKLDFYKKQGQADADIKASEPGAPEQMAKSLGNIKGVDGQPMFAPNEIKKMVQEKSTGAAGRPKMHPVMTGDPSDPTGVRQIPAMQDMDPPYYVYAPGSTEPMANPGKLLPAMLPSTVTSSSQYSADSGITNTSRTTQKVAPKGKSGLPAPPSKSGGAAATAKPAASSGGRVAALAERWRRFGDVPAGKDKSQVEQYMSENNITPGTKPTGIEIKLRDDIKKVEPKVAELAKFLEDNNLTQAGQGGMFSPSAWYERSKVEKAWKEYNSGLPPKDKQLGQLIKASAAIKIMGAAPWMSIGRGRYIYSEIVQHLPETTDTPAQLYEKVQFYKTILDDAKGSLPEQLQDQEPGQGGSKPPSLLMSPEASAARAILKKHGVISDAP